MIQEKNAHYCSQTSTASSRPTEHIEAADDVKDEKKSTKTASHVSHAVGPSVEEWQELDDAIQQRTSHYCSQTSATSSPRENNGGANRFGREKRI